MPVRAHLTSHCAGIISAHLRKGWLDACYGQLSEISVKPTELPNVGDISESFPYGLSPGILPFHLIHTIRLAGSCILT